MSQTRRCQDKIALITAGAQGIGYFSTLQLAEQGAIVYCTDINFSKLQSDIVNNPNISPEIKQRIRIHALDVTKVEQIEGLCHLIEKENNGKSANVIFNCAGYVHAGSILDATIEQLDFAFSINCKSMFFIIKMFLPGMIKNGGGSIINMSSVASSVKGVPNRCVYGITKAAVIGLTKQIAAEFVRQGIRCNAICPGTVQTPSLDDRISSMKGDSEENRRQFISRQPMGRLGNPSEIASLVVYLSSDESSYTTGQEFCIDGGWTL